MTEQVYENNYTCKFVPPNVRECFVRFDLLLNDSLPALNIVESELANRQINSGYTFI